MKLILVNLYPSGTIARYLLSSYVLKAYLIQFLEDYEIEIDILNFNANTSIERIRGEVTKRKPDFIGYSCYAWNIERVLEITGTLKTSSNFIQILGGPEISLARVSSLPRPVAFDYCIIGEGERVLANLLHYLAIPKSLRSEVPRGVVYWDGTEIVYTGSAERIHNLDEIPSVYLTGILDGCLYTGRQAFLETQRGCIFRCKYCVYHKNLPKVSFYSFQRVLDELEHLIVKKKVKALRIVDALFTSDLPRAKKIVRYLLELKEKRIELPWIYWEFTYDTVDEEFVKLVAMLKNDIRLANTNHILPVDRPQLYSDLLKDYTAINCIGIQSFCEQALKAVSRARIDVEKLQAFMNIARENNIVLKVDLILGLPFETFDSYFAGLEFFLPFFKGTDHILNIHQLQILPGSGLEQMCGIYGIQYSQKAPHWVLSTASFSFQQLNYASKLTAVLFRLLNSPIRRYFFATQEYTHESFGKLIERIFRALASSHEFKRTRLIQYDRVDDDYWNDQVFREIPSNWLIAFLVNHCNGKIDTADVKFNRPLA